ncbi:MAG: Crp/Fnr family transcriptional regulator [Bdellovibrionia bacterium]
MGQAEKPQLQAVPSLQGPQKRTLKKGDLIFAEGENSRAMYLLQSGMIRIFKKKGDAQIELDTIRSGQVLGELAFLDGNPRSASGEALVDSEIIEISGPTFQATLAQMPDWLKILLKTIVGRLRTASTRIRQLESASTAVDYSDKNAKPGKRSSAYVFLGALDVLKTLSGFLLIASRYGKPTADGKGVEMRMGMATRYMNQIMGVPEAKITSMTDALFQAGLFTLQEDQVNLANSKTLLNDVQFLDQLIAYLNDENLCDPSKRHDITPRSFYIMSLVAKHLKSFPVDEKSGLTSVNLNAIRKADAGSNGKEAFALHEFQGLIKLGYATNIDFKSADEAVTLINAEEFTKSYRFQRFCMIVQAINEQKRK